MTYSPEYLDALDALLALEGGYSDHPQDTGGETLYGIARNYWPQYWADGPPTRETAERFYWTEFWVPMRLEALLDQRLRAELLESGVNCGARNGIKFAQRAYNLLRETSWQDIAVDGRNGPQTIRAVNRISRSYADAVLAACNYYQAHYYATRANNRAFVRGWFARRLRW